jgi:hypothetical protein
MFFIDAAAFDACNDLLKESKVRRGRSIFWIAGMNMTNIRPCFVSQGRLIGNLLGVMER